MARDEAYKFLVSGRAWLGFDRPAWLYRGRGAIPRLESSFREARPVTDADVALCERLIAAHRQAVIDAPKLEGMWTTDLFKERQRALAAPLADRDPVALAERLAVMFRSDFVIGMAGGSLGLVVGSAASRRFTSLYILNKIAALAESQATARIENPEQGEIGLAFVKGLETLMADTEAALGFSLDFPSVGAAYGLPVAGRLIPSDWPDQIYAAARLRDAVRTFLPDRLPSLRIVEIGGGYGAMPYCALRMIPLGRYTIIDLPVVNVLQGYFLSQALGVADVSLYGEAPLRVAIMPTHALQQIETPFDVLANKDSAPEIARPALIDYLMWARASCKGGILYSYNQEAAAQFGGDAQSVLPEITADLGGFNRVRRDSSWLRRGYAEEIYRIA